MRYLKNLLSALAFLIGASIVIGALALCFLHLLIGGVA
jgi:nitrogen fixation-related uncharacterized protein